MIDISIGSISSANVGYGEVGTNGTLGHEVDGRSTVSLPFAEETWNDIDTISAHPPSGVCIHTANTLRVAGVMDSSSWSTSTPTVFKIDGMIVGELNGPGQRTFEVLVTPGDHLLETICSGDTTRRYPIWTLRHSNPGEFRIVIPISDGYHAVADDTIKLLDRYWPSRPAIDAVCCTEGLDIRVFDRIQTHVLGSNAQACWTFGLRDFLERTYKQEYLLLLLDDYALFAPPDGDRLDQAVALMQNDPSIGSFRLTHICNPSEPLYQSESDVIQYPAWDYSIHLQAAIWRRSSLLRSLHAVGDVDAVEFELAGSRFFNEHGHRYERHLAYASPKETPLFIDSDSRKGDWVVPYHNLIRRGQYDSRHESFVIDHGLNASRGVGR